VSGELVVVESMVGTQAVAQAVADRLGSRPATTAERAS
jgi:hypothetical protein